MSSLLNRRFQQSSGTSALGSMRQSETYHLIATRVFRAVPSTASIRSQADQNALAVLDMTSSGLTLPSVSSTEATQKALNELRKLSGLTWIQLARLFNVSRRSLHAWASGQPLSRFNEESLNRLLGTIQYIDRGSASLNRSLLFSPDHDGRPLIDRLVAGHYEDVKQILGRGNVPQKPQLTPLSKEAQESRVLQSPADLVDAIQDPIHREVGQSRPVRAARNRRNDSER